jgi:hypothetical protein
MGFENNFGPGTEIVGPRLGRVVAVPDCFERLEERKLRFQVRELNVDLNLKNAQLT